jgi:hypothetical protein
MAGQEFPEMASLLKNVASQNITFALINATTGAALTGATVIVKVSKDGGAQASGAGSVTELGNGQYVYAPTQSETSATDIGFLFAAVGAVPENLDFHTDVVDANNLLKVDVEDINGSATAGQALAKSTQSICWGTCSGGSTTSEITASLNNPSSLTDSGQLIGRTIIFLGNTGTANVQAQASNITGSTTGSTPTISFTTMTHAPANGDVFVIV